MSENLSQNSESAIEVSEGIFTKVKNILTSKKGMYLVGAILLIGAIYYYTQCYNKKGKSKKDKSNASEETDIPEPPPGYVTVPVEMLQGLQQDQMYHEIPNNMNQQMPEQQQQQMPEQQKQQMQQQQMQQQSSRPPQLKHNSRLDEDEEDEIANQNLSKNDMESIQAQLNAMQEGSNA